MYALNWKVKLGEVTTLPNCFLVCVHIDCNCLVNNKEFTVDRIRNFLIIDKVMVLNESVMTVHDPFLKHCHS